MRVLAVLLTAAALGGCASTHPTPPAPSPQAPLRRDVFVRRDGVDVFSPSSGEAAIAAFKPGVAPFDSAGECLLTRTAGSGATRVIAMFPSRTSSKMRVTLAFDSSGRLIQYTESRGVVPAVHLPATTPRAQLDSAIRASRVGVHMTSINLNYPLDQALALNRDGDRTTNAVIGTVRSMENRESLGNPRARMERVRKLCGV